MMAFDTLLVANRGEIACRVIRTAGTGPETVAVFGPTRAVRCWLTKPCRLGRSAKAFAGDRIIAAGNRLGRAIHPGYGFPSPKMPNRSRRWAGFRRSARAGHPRNGRAPAADDRGGRALRAWLRR